MQSKLNLKIFAFLFGITTIAFFYRVYGIFSNTPFWVDEFSTGRQSRQILQYGLSVFTTSNINVEIHNITTYFLVALFFKILGQKEWVARLPFVFIGSFIPLLIFLITRKLYNIQTAICATILTTFSYFEITWSRQARGYVLIQFLVLFSMYLYFKLEEQSKNIRLYQALFLLTILLGILTHAFFLIFLASVFIYILFFQNDIVKAILKTPITYGTLIVALILAFKTGLLSQLINEFLLSNPIKANNLWYYHSFLWREYGLVCFMAILGFIVGATGRSPLQRKYINLIIIYTIFHLIFICYFLTAYVSRYVLPIFPFFLIGMSYSIVQLTSFINIPVRYERLRMIIPIILVLFIIGSGDKFVNKPKRFYSVNHDFREIALIDYHELYGLIKQKVASQNGTVAIVDTWSDRLFWYMGRDFRPAYIFRWNGEAGTVNGLKKLTYFNYNSEGEKIIPNQQNLRFIGELSDLKKMLKKYPKGFIFIDDASLPKEVIAYAEKNFKKELYLDHYPLDDNPYSIWPATLYSWGM